MSPSSGNHRVAPTKGTFQEAYTVSCSESSKACIEKERKKKKTSKIMVSKMALKERENFFLPQFKEACVTSYAGV